MKRFYFILYLVSSTLWAQIDCNQPMSNYTSINFSTINNNITGIHNASTSITAINEIQNATYLAPEIKLNDGFKATAGSEVLISIENCPLSNTPIDLYIKDDSADTGIEPNTVSIAWNSPDIWVRNSDDNQLTHQVPIYGQQNFVYIKVKNKSTTSITPTSHIAAQVELYRTLPTPFPDEVEYQMRSMSPSANEYNSFVGTQNISSLPANGSTILKFGFYPPIPFVPCGSYYANLNFFAKIVSQNDLLSFSETGNINYDVKRNNNYAAKNNINIGGMVYEFDGHFIEKIQINNPKNTVGIYRLELKKEDLETGKPIYEEAEVGIKMDDILYAAWERGGKIVSNTIETSDLQKQIVEDNQVLIDNIILEPYESGFVDVSFNFLMDELTEKTNFAYHLIQRDALTNEILGGVTFDVKKNIFSPFDADANDKEIDKFESITLSAEDIGEQAIYNWYDSEGNLVYDGKDLFIANAVAEKYKLEVISSIDGFKDYKDVEVTLKPNRLETLYPNPASSGNLNIRYKINEANSAYIMITSYYMSGGISNNYIIDKDANEKNIDLSSYPNGFYKVALITDGQIVDVKILSKL